MIAFASLCPTVAILLVAGICLWRWLARIKNQVARAVARIASTMVLLIPIGPSVWFQVARPFTDGEYVCIACGHSARRLMWFDVPLWIGPARMDRGTGATSDRYAAAVGLGEHSHDWFPIGCRQFGFTKIGCTMISGATWFAKLPDVEDRELVRALAARLRAATDRERHTLLYSFRSSTGSLESDASRFDAWHEAWLRGHPDWP